MDVQKEKKSQGESKNKSTTGILVCHSYILNHYLQIQISLAAGYEGSHCETEVNECLSNPCQNNGYCTDAVNGYQCGCLDGFKGKYASKDAISDYMDVMKQAYECLVRHFIDTANKYFT